MERAMLKDTFRFIYQKRMMHQTAEKKVKNLHQGIVFNLIGKTFFQIFL